MVGAPGTVAAVVIELDADQGLWPTELDAATVTE